jgi:heme-degrading monooxygenase HmoA
MIVVASRITVQKGREREFERQFFARPKLVDMMPGFIRNEFLKPLNNNTYIILSYWETREDVEAWMKTDAFHLNQMRKSGRDCLSGPIQLDLHEVVGISERIREM